MVGFYSVSMVLAVTPGLKGCLLYFKCERKKIVIYKPKMKVCISDMHVEVLLEMKNTVAHTIFMKSDDIYSIGHIKRR